MADDLNDRKANQNFLTSLLSDVPGFVRGILATMFGTTICFVAMLQLGGLQVPFMNWLTGQMQKPVDDLNKSVAALQQVIVRLERVESVQASTEGKINTLAATVHATNSKLSEVEQRVRRVEIDHGITLK